MHHFVCFIASSLVWGRASVTAVISPRIEALFCAQPACDANHVTSRRCWRLQEGCLEHALIGGVTFAFFSLSEFRRRKLF